MPTIPLYVSCAKSREVQVFVLDPEQGSLLLLQRKSLPGEVLHLKLSADRRLLLAGTRGEDALHAFSVAPTYGTLRLLGSIPSPGAPTYVGLTPERDMAFVASYRNNLLAAFPLTPRGRPRAATQILPELPRAHAAICPSDGRWLIVPTLGTDTIHSFALNTGHPQPLTSPAAAAVRVRPGSGPRHLVLSKDGSRAYCLNELDNSLDAFDFNLETGQLVLRESLSLCAHGFAGDPWAAELRLAPAGRYLYATDRRSSTIACVEISSDSGRLALIGHVATENQPRGMAVSPCGRWLAVSGQASHHLTLYALDPNSGLPTEHLRVPAGEEPICVEMPAA